MESSEKEANDNHRRNETAMNGSSVKETINITDKKLNKPTEPETNTFNNSGIAAIDSKNTLLEMDEQVVKNPSVEELPIPLSNNTEDVSNENKVGQENVPTKFHCPWTQTQRRNETEINVKKDKFHTDPVPSTSNKDLSVSIVNTNYTIPSTSNDVSQIKLHTDQTPCTSRQASVIEQLEMYNSRLISSNEKYDYSQLCYINPEVTGRVHVSDSFKPSFLCKFCGLDNLSCLELTFHLKGYHRIRKYVCDICKTPFKNLKLLRNHFMNQHPFGEFICCFCPYSDSSLSNLKQHIRKQHPELSCLRSCRTCNGNFILDEIYKNIITFHRPH